MTWQCGPESMREAKRIRDDVWPEAMALLPARMNTIEALAFGLAVGFQESEFLTRMQIGGGPGRSYFQFEAGGGVVGVLTHHASAKYAAEVCRARSVPATRTLVHRALATDDVLGCAFTRLLMWTHRESLPLPAETDRAWQIYAKDLWRPGNPHLKKWAMNWHDAWVLAVTR